MASYANLAALFSAIASAIRTKTGQSAQIVANDFPDAIAAIPSGGTASGLLAPYRRNYRRGFCGNGWWGTYTYREYSNDFYQLTAGHRYLIGLGGRVGNRFRTAAFTEDPSGRPEGHDYEVAGLQIGTDLSDPSKYLLDRTYTPTTHTVLVVYKGNDPTTADDAAAFVLDLDTVIAP